MKLGSIRWRKLFRSLHRDIGYVVAALTLAYSISGIAVNHIEDWNPNYTFANTRIDVGALPVGDYQAMQDHIVGALNLDVRAVKGHFMETETLFRVFLQNSEEVSVDVPEPARGSLRKSRRGRFSTRSMRCTSTASKAFGPGWPTPLRFC